MAFSDRCRTALRNLEAMVRDDHAKLDLMQRACGELFLIDGKVCYLRFLNFVELIRSLLQ